MDDEDADFSSGPSGPSGTKGSAASSRDRDGAAPGRIPIFLNMSLERYGFMKGTRVTDIVDHKLLKKADVLNDLEELKDSSDLYPLKDKIEEFEGDTLLFIRGPQNEYDYNYLWCSTLDSYEDGMSEIKDRQRMEGGDGDSSKLGGSSSGGGGGDYDTLGGEEDEEWPDKNKRNRFGKGDGDEKVVIKRADIELSPIEIATYHVKNHRPRISFTITQPRFKFCKGTDFDDVEPGEKPAEYPRQKIPNYLETKVVLEMGFQASNECVDISTQTFKLNSMNKTTQYTPMNYKEEEKKSIMESEAMSDFISSVRDLMFSELCKNEVLDPFQDEFIELYEDDGAALGNRNENNLEVFHSFHHMKYSKNRNINCIQWHPYKSLISFSCSNNITFDQWVENSGKVVSSSVLMYMLNDLLHPYLILDVPGNIQTFKFHPTNPDYVAGGLSTGQVIFWDLTDARSKVQKYQLQQQMNSNIAGKSSSTQQQQASQQSSSQAPATSKPHQKASQTDTNNTAAPSEQIEDVSIPTIKYTILSYIDRSHARPVTDLVWLPPHMQVNRKGEYVTAQDKNMTNQFVTIAADGKIMVWDIKNKNEQRSQGQAGIAAAAAAAGTNTTPAAGSTTGTAAAGVGANAAGGANAPLGSLALKAAQQAAQDDPDAKEPRWAPLYTCSLLKPTDPSAQGQGGGGGGGSQQQGLVSANKLSIGDYYIMAVSEDGDVAEIDIGARASEERSRPEIVKALQHAHFQACSSIERSPHFNDIYMTVGDWTFSIWKVGVPYPVFTSSCSSDYLSCGRWSPTRPGIIITARADGTIDVWDLVDQCHKSSLNFQTGFADGLSSLEFWQSKTNSTQYLGCGDVGGKCHIIEIPRNIRRKVPNEENIMRLFYEREIARQAYVRKRNEAKKAAADAQQQNAKKVSILTPTLEEQAAQQQQGGAQPTTTSAAVAPTKEEKITEQQIKEKAEKQKALEEEKAEKDYQRLLEQFKQQLSGSDL